MKIKVYWKETEFLEVEKKEDKYFSRVVASNYNIVKEQGCPVMFLNNIKAIDDTLPKIIQSRLPKISNLLENLKKDSNMEDEILEYINKTRCERATDYITLDIEK